MENLQRQFQFITGYDSVVLILTKIDSSKKCSPFLTYWNKKRRIYFSFLVSATIEAIVFIRQLKLI